MTPKIPESVLVVIHSPDLQILMLERADQPGFWQSVTGSKDTLEEAPAETALRELQEETGVVACAPNSGHAPHSLLVLHNMQHSIEYEIFEHWRWRYAPGVTHNTEHWFSVCIPLQTPVRLAPKEHLRYEWMPWQQAAERCFSWSNSDAIKRLVAGL